MKKILFLLLIAILQIPSAIGQQKRFILKDGVIQLMEVYDSASVRALIDSKLSTAAAASTYQPIGIYLVAGNNLADVSNTTSARTNILPSKTGNANKILSVNTSETDYELISLPTSMVYPGAGIPISTGIAWGTSITDNSTNWNTAYSQTRQWDGGSTGLVAGTGRTSLGGSTIGQNVFTSTNPSAIRFGRANSDNSFDWLDASTFRTAIGAGTGDGTVTGTGTTNTMSKWTSSTAIGNSSVNDDGSIVSTASQLWVSKTGAVATPGGAFTGAWYSGGTGTTTKPYLLIEPTAAASTGWSTSGTGMGINAASGFTGNLFDAQLNAVSKFSVDYSGVVNASAGYKGSYLTASELLITDGSKNIVSAPVATYPSLTELSYVKGVTSAIQTQINALPTASSTTTFTNKNTVLSIVTKTASDTLELTDAGKDIEMNVGSANNISIPTNASVAFPIGTQIVLTQLGSGQTSVVALAGVTIRSSGGKLKITDQYSGATLIKRDTNEWVLFGNLSL